MNFDTGLSKFAWPALSALARMHGDAFVDLVTIEPCLGTVRYPAQWDRYPSLSLSVDASPEDYEAATWELCPDGVGRMIGDFADVVVISGASRRWGCWGERAPEIMAIAAPDTPEHQLWRRNFDFDLCDAYAALGIMAKACRKMRVPMHFVEPFIDNYTWTSGLRPLDLLVDS